jgi:tRNA nucleotidyltransferase/poly(A) polymerase
MALYAVGGCVRDWILRVDTKDLDLVAEEDPLPIARWCAHRWKGQLEIFERFLTARVLLREGSRIDFACTREELYLQPAALPVVRGGTLHRDLIRRDFTINAMAARLTEKGLGDIVDPYGGQEDIRRKRLRVLHADSFRDDPTRLFRAARFACRFKFKLDAPTDAYRKEAVNAKWADRLSRERVRTELLRILEERVPDCALEKLKSWNLIYLVHPKLSWPSDWSKSCDIWHRLGMVALRTGPNAKAFIESLHLERPVSHALIEAMDLARDQTAPRTPIAPLTRDILRYSVKGLADSATDPLLVSGKDLSAVGLKPGPVYKRWLELASKAQWAGEFSTRSQALRWLKRKAGMDGHGSNAS